MILPTCLKTYYVDSFVFFMNNFRNNNMFSFVDSGIIWVNEKSRDILHQPGKNIDFENKELADKKLLEFSA